ncbi:MAG: hypothetical protein SFW67_17620 [Myxococcaceae bacterium]|nr:hypothetical protein [Myxococcaceae bacterium]
MTELALLMVDRTAPEVPRAEGIVLVRGPWGSVESAGLPVYELRLAPGAVEAESRLQAKLTTGLNLGLFAVAPRIPLPSFGSPDLVVSAIDGAGNSSTAISVSRSEFIVSFARSGPDFVGTNPNGVEAVVTLENIANRVDGVPVVGDDVVGLDARRVRVRGGARWSQISQGAASFPTVPPVFDEGRGWALTSTAPARLLRGEQQVDVASPDALRAGTIGAYDRRRELIMIFGGPSQAPSALVTSFNGVSWVAEEPLPIPLRSIAAGWDEGRGGVLVLGTDDAGVRRAFLRGDRAFSPIEVSSLPSAVIRPGRTSPDPVWLLTDGGALRARDGRLESIVEPDPFEVPEAIASPRCFNGSLTSSFDLGWFDSNRQTIRGWARAEYEGVSPGGDPCTTTVETRLIGLGGRYEASQNGQFFASVSCSDGGCVVLDDLPGVGQIWTWAEDRGRRRPYPPVATPPFPKLALQSNGRPLVTTSAGLAEFEDAGWVRRLNEPIVTALDTNAGTTAVYVEGAPYRLRLYSPSWALQSQTEFFRAFARGRPFLVSTGMGEVLGYSSDEILTFDRDGGYSVEKVPLEWLTRDFAGSGVLFGVNGQIVQRATSEQFIPLSDPLQQGRPPSVDAITTDERSQDLYAVARPSLWKLSFGDRRPALMASVVVPAGGYEHPWRLVSTAIDVSAGGSGPDGEGFEVLGWNAGTWELLGASPAASPLLPSTFAPDGGWASVAGSRRILRLAIAPRSRNRAVGAVLEVDSLQVRLRFER